MREVDIKQVFMDFNLLDGENNTLVAELDSQNLLKAFASNFELWNLSKLMYLELCIHGFDNI